MIQGGAPTDMHHMQANPCHPLKSRVSKLPFNNVAEAFTQLLAQRISATATDFNLTIKLPFWKTSQHSMQAPASFKNRQNKIWRLNIKPLRALIK